MTPSERNAELTQALQEHRCNRYPVRPVGTVRKIAEHHARHAIEGAELRPGTVLTIDDSAHLAIYTGGHREPHASTTELLVPGPNGSSLIRITQNAPPASGGSHGQPIAIVPNGAAADTPWGAVHLVQSDTQSTVVLAGNGLELRQMIGTVTGALVANTASDRVIDTMVTFDLDIRHSAIPTSAMMLRLDSLLAGAAARGGY